ncbi:14095_t:CDS:2 [Entrophospora sp. SA101]|nr:10149_t:CDS:2 [Entrophospora sp. SA101]CAJ0625567.1 8561_t:CDS:2 [Entrophospora sp. SA101]CAJ0755412.1 14095_t:CDS:2 [Entrophospora sp. SA101]CAJ0823250.1 4053_t:CDS:2 [Entrophospora sp. SA101]CAJ0847065.1 4500_t:CDS:2 [Entrophospora sp. SA101]
MEESTAHLLSDAPLEPDVEIGINDGQKTNVRGNTSSSQTNNTSSTSTPAAPSQSIWDQSSHPIALFFHLFFRGLAIIIYLFGTYFVDNFPLIFILCVLCLSFDFWTVKNVTGRLLVGLRWWNDIQEDGSNMWMFESRDPSRPVNPTDSRIFWISLYATIVIWIFFGFFALLKQWFLIVLVALSLNIANAIGYTQCDKDAKKKWASNLASRAASESPSLVGRLFTAGIGKYFG